MSSNLSNVVTIWHCFRLFFVLLFGRIKYNLWGYVVVVWCVIHLLNQTLFENLFSESIFGLLCHASLSIRKRFFVLSTGQQDREQLQLWVPESFECIRGIAHAHMLPESLWLERVRETERQREKDRERETKRQRQSQCICDRETIRSRQRERERHDR